MAISLPRTAALAVTSALAGCVTLGANGETEQATPAAASDDAEGASLVAVNPAEFVRCQAACNSGKEAMFAFCRSLPDPRLKQPCWIAAAGTAIFCANWCYWAYGK